MLSVRSRSLPCLVSLVAPGRVFSRSPVRSMWCSCVLFGPWPKPRQARDGHSWRMAAALLVLPAGPAPLLPTCVGGVWKAGVRLSGPSADPRALLAVVRGVLVDASGSRLSLRRPCHSRVPFPEPGRGGWSVAVHTRSRLVFARALLLRDLAVLLERSGLLIIEVPASELAAALPFPGVPPVLRLAACFVSRLAL